MNVQVINGVHVLCFAFLLAIQYAVYRFVLKDAITLSIYAPNVFTKLENLAFEILFQ